MFSTVQMEKEAENRWKNVKIVPVVVVVQKVQNKNKLRETRPFLLRNSTERRINYPVPIPSSFLMMMEESRNLLNSVKSLLLFHSPH